MFEIESIFTVIFVIMIIFIKQNEIICLKLSLELGVYELKPLWFCTKFYALELPGYSQADLREKK